MGKYEYPTVLTFPPRGDASCEHLHHPSFVEYQEPGTWYVFNRPSCLFSSMAGGVCRVACRPKTATFGHPLSAVLPPPAAAAAAAAAISERA